VKTHGTKKDLLLLALRSHTKHIAANRMLSNLGCFKH
jgi:hypothetical protein